MLVLILSAVLGTNQADEARALLALAVAFAPAEVSAPETPPPPKAVRAEPSYGECRREAIRTGKPLAVWVGQPAEDIPGWLSCRRDDFPGVVGPAVVIGYGVDAGGDLIRAGTLTGVQTGEQVSAWLMARRRRGEGQSPAAGPARAVWVVQPAASRVVGYPSPPRSVFHLSASGRGGC